MTAIRMAQYGTKHVHATAIMQVMHQSPAVELAGVYEPDPHRRRELEEGDTPYRGIVWFDSKRDMLEDPTIEAIASEGHTGESLGQTEEIVEAGKHVWYNKPAGDNWEQWQRVVALAREKGVTIYMGYVWRHHDGFKRMVDWARSGLLGDVFAIRGHISAWISELGREFMSGHPGGIFYDLGCHIIDNVVYLLGRPQRVTSFLRNDSGNVPEFMDNTLAVFEYEKALAVVDISAIQRPPLTRRFEVYGTRGSAIMDPFEPVHSVRLRLEEDVRGYKQGEQDVPIQYHTRESLYEIEQRAFLATIGGKRPPDRSFEHELLLQETLLRATGRIPGG